MVAPQLTKGTKRKVYIPNGSWIEIRTKYNEEYMKSKFLYQDYQFLRRHKNDLQNN